MRFEETEERMMERMRAEAEITRMGSEDADVLGEESSGEESVSSSSSSSTSEHEIKPVSYTHLTLPTIYSV